MKVSCRYGTYNEVNRGFSESLVHPYAISHSCHSLFRNIPFATPIATPGDLQRPMGPPDSHCMYGIGSPFR